MAIFIETQPDRTARDQRLVDQAWAYQSDTDHSLQEKFRTKEAKEIIDVAISQLSIQKQTIFRLSREQGLNHAEIAKNVGLSQSRVKNILVEILKHIKANLLKNSDILVSSPFFQFFKINFYFKKRVGLPVLHYGSRCLYYNQVTISFSEFLNF